MTEVRVKIFHAEHDAHLCYCSLRAQQQTRFAMHRIYALGINSRGMSRIFRELRSQKTPRGIFPVDSNAKGLSIT